MMKLRVAFRVPAPSLSSSAIISNGHWVKALRPAFCHTQKRQQRFEKCIGKPCRCSREP